MHVIDMARQIILIADEMLPEPLCQTVDSRRMIRDCGGGTMSSIQYALRRDTCCLISDQRNEKL